MNYLFTKNIAIALLAIALTSCASSQNGEKIKSLIAPSSDLEVATKTEPQATAEIPQSSTSSEENEPKTITQSSSGITPQQLNRRVKQFTVRIDGAQNGSGVIIDQSDDIYTVLTNWHVVQEAAEYTIQTSDGREHQVNYQQVEQLPGVDLALVKFTSEQNYQIAEVGDSDYLSEGQAVHLAGYPGVKTNNDRLYRFYNLNIVGLLDKPINQGYSVLYEGETISGMSGSPLLDGEGNLVGIHGIYRVDDPSIRQGSSYAIPINTYKELVAEESGSTDTVASQPNPVAIKKDIKPIDNSSPAQKKPEDNIIANQETTDEKIIVQSSETGINYSRLEELLATEDWQEAHQETRDLMIQAGGREEDGSLNEESIKNFPCQDLNTIDGLWSKYSDGKLGFNAQRQIWENIGGNTSSDNDTLAKFSTQVGWKNENAEKHEFLEYSELTFNPQIAVEGHLPPLTFIPGIFHPTYPGSTGGYTLIPEFLYRVRTCSKTSAIPQTETTENSTASNSDIQEELVENLNASVTESEIIVPLSTDVLFDFDRADIREDAISTLKKLAQAISKLKLKMIQIAGHTDSKGSDEYNLQLSQQRAEAVAAWLVNNTNMTSDRLISKGYGETQPVADNQKPNGEDNPEGRAKNRRVEVIIPQ